MGFKALTVNTPASEPAHFLAEDDAAIYGGIIGGDCVLDVGNKLKATVITNNSVRISDGVAFVGGHAGRVIKGDYEDMVITNGVSGQKRYDLIVARFLTTGPGGTDTFKLAVVKGASGATPTDPAVVKGDLYAGDKQRDYPLWRVCLDGLSIVKVEQLFEIVPDIKTLNKDLLDVNKVRYGDKTMIANQTRGACNVELRGKSACINITGGQFPPIGTTAVNILRLGTDCRPALTQQGYFIMAGIAVLYIIKVDGTVSFQTLSGTLNTDASWNVVVHFFTV